MDEGSVSGVPGLAFYSFDHDPNQADFGKPHVMRGVQPWVLARCGSRKVLASPSRAEVGRCLH